MVGAHHEPGTIGAVALYEYRCRTCDETFEARRPMSEANAPATCPQGHADSVRLLSVFASVGASGGDRSSAMPASAPSSAPCGSHCGCHH